DRDLGQRLLEAELAQLLAGVRQDIDADAERLDLRRGLVDAAGDAAPLQHEPEREPAYAAADDQYFHDSLRNTTIAAPAGAGVPKLVARSRLGQQVARGAVSVWGYCRGRLPGGGAAPLPRASSIRARQLEFSPTPASMGGSRPRMAVRTVLNALASGPRSSDLSGSGKMSRLSKLPRIRSGWRKVRGLKSLGCGMSSRLISSARMST